MHKINKPLIPIESMDHLPVNKLNASGLSGRKQKPLRKNSVCFITREQFKMIENKPVNTLRQGFTAISDIIAFFVTFQNLIANIFRRLFRDPVRTRKVKHHTYLMLQKCLFQRTILFARKFSMVTGLSNRINSSIDSSFVTPVIQIFQLLVI